MYPKMDLLLLYFVFRTLAKLIFMFYVQGSRAQKDIFQQILLHAAVNKKKTFLQRAVSRDFRLHLTTLSGHPGKTILS
jgi:hypothetical protein